MSRLLIGKINVEAIDKTKLFKGKKGTYLDLVVWVNDEDDQFGNIASIQQGVSKEEREAGTKIYLGNLQNPGGAKPTTTDATADESEDSNDLPF